MKESETEAAFHELLKRLGTVTTFERFLGLEAKPGETEEDESQQSMIANMIRPR